jgi:hypothetical protein
MSEVLSASSYQKFNLSSRLLTEAGVIYMDKVTLSGIAKSTLNSNIIDRENLYAGNISVHLFDWLDITTSYSKRDIVINHDQSSIKKEEIVHQFVFGLIGRF